MKLDELAQPSEVTRIDLAFPARGVDLMPDLDIIPAEFLDDTVRANKWVRLVSTWFGAGFPEGTGLLPAEGIDPEAATNHVVVVLGCYGIKHEHKIAGAAYLLSLWFTDIVDIPAEEVAPAPA